MEVILREHVEHLGARGDVVKVAAGYAPVMPTFAGQVREDDLAKLVAYIESIGPQRSGDR